MTTSADDAAVEDAFEAYLAGRPVPGTAADAFAGLAAFSEAVRATATLPGRPSAALAELLAAGHLTDQSIPSAPTATSAASPPARRITRGRIRRRTAMILPALLAKLLSAGAIAQAATGAGVAVVVATGAGAAGVLPDPVQNTVSTVVQAMTPFEVPGGRQPVIQRPVDQEPVVEEPVEGAPVVGEPVVEQPAVGAPAGFDARLWAAQGPASYPSFGTWVRDGARHGAFKGEGVRFGAVVSAHARAKGLDQEDLAEEGVDLEELLGGGSAEPAPAPDTTDGGSTAQAPTPGHGHGHGNGHGNGNGDGKGHGHGKAGSTGDSGDKGDDREGDRHGNGRS